MAPTQPMPIDDRQTIDLIALVVQPKSVRCRRVDTKKDVTYRRVLPNVVPGMRLTVLPGRILAFRDRDVMSGELVSSDFSLRGLQQAGFARPVWHQREGIVSPGDSLDEIQDALGHPHPPSVLVDIFSRALAQEPANLFAHSAMGGIWRTHEQPERASAHYTAAIRLGMGALVVEDSVPLRHTEVDGTERALIRALVGRAKLLHEKGRLEAACGDLQRACTYDPADVLHQSTRLKELLLLQVGGGE